MSKIVREGDVNTAGGRVARGVSSFIVDNKKAAVDGSPVTGHPTRPPCRCDRTANGNKNFIIENTPVNVYGDVDTCGHSRSQGSSDFIIG